MLMDPVLSVTVHCALLVGPPNGMKGPITVLPDPPIHAITIPVPSFSVAEPEPLKLKPVTASQSVVAEMLKIESAFAGAAEPHKMQSSRNASELRTRDAPD